MDFTILIAQIQKDSKNYELEFEKNLNTYKNLVSLPKSQFSLIISYVNFLTTTCHFYPTKNYAEILINHIEFVNDAKIKKELLNNIFIVKHKKLVDDFTFFKVLYKHADLQKILSKVTIEIKNPIILLNLIKEYLDIGDSKQSTFSAYMLCYLYEVYEILECEDLICECFTKDKKIQNIVILYFLNELEFNKNDEPRILKNVGKKRGKKIIDYLFKNLKGDKREERIKKLECMDIIKKNNGIKFNIAEYIYKMIDPSKEDLKPLMELLVDNLDNNMKILDEMIKKFCVEYKDDDFIVYGLNFLKEVCLRNDYGDFILERVDIFNKHKNAAINVAYRGIVKAIKDKDDDEKGILYIRRKKTKTERIELKKSGVDRSKFKRKHNKSDKKNKKKVNRTKSLKKR